MSRPEKGVRLSCGIGVLVLLVSLANVASADVDELGDPTETRKTLGRFQDYSTATGDVDGDGLPDHASAYDQLDATLTAVIDFAEKLDGERELIWETGGSGDGFSLVYEAPNSLVLRSSGTGSSLALVRYELTDSHIEGGNLSLAWTFDVTDDLGFQVITLFVNDGRAGFASMALGADWSGTDDASFGLETTGFAGTGAASNLRGIDFASGVINLDEGLNFYSDVLYCPEASDTDGDDLPDEWENLFAPGDLGRLGTGDADGDDLADVEEFEAGTNPVNADTDGDELTDEEELVLGTNPIVADTDYDGLTDPEELDGDPETDPTNPDTDGDGFTDGREIEKGSDPTDLLDFPSDCTNDLGDPTEDPITVLGAYPSYERAGFDKLDVTFTAVIDFEDKLDGERELIWETGGSGTGFSLVYEEPSTLVLRSSGAGTTLAMVRYELTDDHIADGDLDIVWAYDGDDGQGLSAISLFVNNVEVGSAAEALGGDWSGSNNASFGVDSSGFAGSGAGTDLRGIDFMAGFINLEEGLNFYSDIVYCPDTNDTDGDGLPDEWEDLFAEGDLDRLGDGDADGDGLTDVEEFEAATNPLNDDTDADELGDGEEIALGTNPINADTDADGLTDGEEVNGDPETDPTNPDTDGDGFTDGREVAKGTDPTDPLDVVPDCTDDLGDPTEEPITVLGGYPSYERNSYDKMDVTFTALVDFEEKLDGERELIWESGGGTVGFSLVYEATSTLVLRASGNGGFSLATASYELTDDQIDDGDLDLAWAYDVDNGEGLQTISLFINSVEVASVTMDLGGDWSGSNNAAFGTASSGVAGDGQNGTIPAIDFMSGLILADEGLNFYSDVFFCPAVVEPPPGGTQFRRGDVTMDGTLNITDPIKILGILFSGEDAPTCQETMDADDDGRVNITDGIGLLGFLFSAGQAPALPGHEQCGPDPADSPAQLGCDAYPACE